jgi:hypothetical protein
VADRLGPSTENADVDTTERAADQASPADHDGLARRPRLDLRHPDANLVVVLLLLVVGVRIGLSSLHDNSFFTHLATGRLILDTGSVPGHDPYSWTAPGHAWTVQSWGASVFYGSVERVMGLVGIRLFDTACIVVLILLLWRLTRPAQSLLGRVIPTGIAVCMGTALWVERPLLFGAVGLALVLLAADDGLDPRWLVPVMWVWVNTHGSFPFGVGVLVLLAAGRWLDDHRRPVVELRALAWATLGTLLGGINPIGPKILVFPLQLLNRRDAFKGVAEWEPPHFHRGVELFFAAQVVLGVALLLSRHRKWRAVLPLVVFAAAAMTGTRNILQASIVFTPILAAAAVGLGSIDGERPHRLLRPVAVALVVLLALVTVFGLSEPNTRMDLYPVAATTYLRRHGMLDVGERVIARDYVGNYLEYRYGPEQTKVFIDDRVDMYPLPVIRDFSAMLDPQRDYAPILDHYRPTAVLWRRDTPMGRWLSHAKAWRVTYRDRHWMVAVPAG